MLSKDMGPGRIGQKAVPPTKKKRHIFPFTKPLFGVPHIFDPQPYPRPVSPEIGVRLVENDRTVHRDLEIHSTSRVFQSPSDVGHTKVRSTWFLLRHSVLAFFSPTRLDVFEGHPSYLAGAFAPILDVAAARLAFGWREGGGFWKILRIGESL